MADNLHLRHSGLCAFVPFYPDHDQATVLLVDAGQPHGPQDAPHVAAVVFTYESWLDNGHIPGSQYRYYDLRFIDGGGTPMGLCYIAGEEIKIDKAPPHALNILGPKAVQGCPAIDGTQDDYFAWVAPMNLINVGEADPRDGCFYAAGADSSVAARLRLTAGSLATYDFARDPSNGAVLQWEFKPTVGGNPAAQQQALAEEVELLYQLNDGYVDLLSSSDIHGTPVPRKPLRLFAQNGNVVAWIVNMPLNEILARDYAGSRSAAAVQQPARQPDYHFIHYYDLLSGGSSNRIPFPVSSCPAAVRPSVDTPRCPPVQLNAHPAA